MRIQLLLSRERVKLKRFKMLLLSGFLVTLSLTSIAAQSLNQACKTPGGNEGRCVPEGSCQLIKGLKKEDGSNQQYVEKFYCGRSHNRERLFCCPELKNESNCGREDLTSIRIMGGEETSVDEYPWTALLGYQFVMRNGSLSRSGRVMFSCGGTLIANQYVVTAAHCVDKVALGRLKLTKVRLGEWNLSTEEDCIDGRCYRYEDISIEKIIIHEHYKTADRNKEHDIALLKLERIVRYQNTIEAICLPTADMINRLNIKKEEFDIAGWGVDETDQFSPVKKKVTVWGKDLGVCQRVFTKSGIRFTRNHLCVGGDGGTGACQGDTGGPLMISKNNRWHLAGVVSLGPRECGTKGYPGIYTNVANYLDWIAANIELASRT